VEHNKQGHSVMLPQIVSYILGVVKDYIFTHLPNRCAAGQQRQGQTGTCMQLLGCYDCSCCCDASGSSATNLTP
jgi:hypothetical protein